MHNQKIETTAEDEKYNLPSIDEAPWLLGTHENQSCKLEKQTFFTINNNTSHVKKIVELHGKSIVASVMGWFILRDRKNLTMFTLWNPITRNSILLPELLGLPEETEPDTYIFNSPPYYEDGFDTATDECVLLLFCKGLVFMCRPTSDGCKWVKQRLEHDGESVRIVKAAILNGDIYAYADLFNDNEDDDHGSFHTVFARLTVGLNSVVLEALSVGCPSSKIVYKMFHRRPHYLVEVCGVLYGVTIIPRQLLNIDGYDILRLCVWKLDFSKMEWIQVDSLGECWLLLGDNCCSWCYADASAGRIEGNCVYMVNRTSDTIHQYRLQDSSYVFLSYQFPECF